MQPVQRVFVPIHSAITWAAHNVPVVKNLCIKALRGVTGADGREAAFRIGLGALFNAINSEQSAIASLGKRSVDADEPPDQLFKKQAWIQELFQELRDESRGILTNIQEKHDARYQHTRQQLMWCQDQVVQAEEKVARAEEKVARAEEKVAQAEMKAARAEEKATRAESEAFRAGEYVKEVYGSQEKLKADMSQVIQTSIETSITNFRNAMNAGALNFQAGDAFNMNALSGNAPNITGYMQDANARDNNLLNISRVPSWINMKISTKNDIIPILETLLSECKSIDLASICRGINNKCRGSLVTDDILREKMNGKINRRIIAQYLRVRNFLRNDIKTQFEAWGLNYINE